MQTLYNQELLAKGVPCVTKNKNGLDARFCSVFGLSLGMLPEQVKHAIDRSGYFDRSPYFMARCTDAKETICPGNIFISRQGLSISADFAVLSAGETTRLSATRIGITLGPTPYQTAEGMRATFVKLFGPPDEITDEHLSWGTMNKTTPSATIRAYPHRGSYWVILEGSR